MGFNLLSVICIIVSVAWFTNAHIEHPTGNNNYKLVTHLLADNVTIEFQLDVTTRGWVGVGVGPSHDMTNADLAVVTINPEDNTTTTWDMYSTRNTMPQNDSNGETDWKLVHSRDTGSTKIFHIQRALKTGDSTEDVDITEEPLYVIWAFGESNDFGIHNRTNRGSTPTKVNLLTPEGEAPGVTPGGASDVKGSLVFLLGIVMLVLAKIF